MRAGGRRRLGRALVFAGVVLAMLELYYLWVLVGSLFLSLRGPNGQLAQVYVHLNGSAWALVIGWAVLCVVLVAWGVKLIRKSKAE